MEKSNNEKQQNLQLMQQIHTQRLHSAASDVERLKKYLEGYDSLQSTLTALPTKLTHNALVPLGAAALIPGQLVHTNNVLVLLGDNWFVETTAHKARDIAARRYQDCKEKLKQAEEALKLQSRWVDRTAEFQQETGCEIVEHLTDEEYKLDAERHKEMVKRYRQHQAKSKQTTATAENTAAGDHRTSRARGPNSMGEATQKEEWLRRLEELELMENEELSSGEGSGDDGSDDSSDSESDSEEDAGPEVAGVGADAGDKTDEDSEEDLPANLHTFKHVKIESPMPSTERKFHYSEDDTSPDQGNAVPLVEDEVADIAAVGEQIRGRTRSFTRTTERGLARCGSQGRDSSNDSKDDPSESKSYSGQRPPVARRVSWADQSSIVSCDENSIKIRYTATPSTTTVTSSIDSTSSSTSVTSTDCFSTISPIVSLDNNVESSQLEIKTAITSPADLVKLTTASTQDNQEALKSSVTKQDEATAAAVAPCEESSSVPKPRSILKKTASQDIIHVPTTKGTSWLQSSESVPITTLYDHEPIVQTSPSPPSQPTLPVMRSKVVARDPDAAPESKTTVTEGPSEAPKRVSKFKAGRQKQLSE